MAEMRNKIPAERNDLARIYNKHKMRTYRQQRTGKDHLLQNLKAKQGMRIFETEGRLHEFTKRSQGKSEEMRDLIAWSPYSVDKNHI
jgi:hypothetical protein